MPLCSNSLFFSRRVTVVIAILMLLSAPSSKAQVPDLVALIERAADTYSMDTASMSDSDFRAFFQSDQFERLMKNESAGASITVPFEGVPVEFGGTFASASAWTKRQQFLRDDRWQFAQRSRTKITWRKNNPEVIRALGELLPRLTVLKSLELNVSANDQVVTAKLKWTPFSINGQPAVPPKITVVDAMGIDASKAEALRGTVVDSNEASLNCPWAGDAAFASLMIGTDQGQLISAYVERPATREALLQYEQPQPGEWVEVGDVKDTCKVWYGNKEKKGDWTQEGFNPLGGGGYLTLYNRAHVTVAGNQRLKNVKAEFFPAGQTKPNNNPGWLYWPGDESSATNSETPVITMGEGNRSATVRVATYSPSGRLELTAKVEELRERWQPARKAVKYTNNVIELVLPAGARNGSLAVFAKDKLRTAALGEPGEGLVYDGMTEQPGLKIYKYKLAE